MKNYNIFLFISFLLFSDISCENVNFDNLENDYSLLENFFKLTCKQESYGYVLEGIKPIDSSSFYCLSNIPISADRDYSESEFIKTLLISKAIPLWQKYFALQDKFVLHVTPRDKSGYDISFINMESLKKTIENNIHLFRYILGSNITPEGLTNEIAYSDKELFTILRNDLVLVGIVLGFGTHNSLCGGRSDKLSSCNTRDLAPYACKGQAIADNMIYWGHYLEAHSGDDSIIRFENLDLTPGYGYQDILEEQKDLESNRVSIPNCLLESPKFIFGAYKESENNKKFFNKLVDSQNYIKKLLCNHNLLEKVFEIINVTTPKLHNYDFASMNKCITYKGWISHDRWHEILTDHMNHLDDNEQKKYFIEGLCNDLTFKEYPNLSGSHASLAGLKMAKSNLISAEKNFKLYSTDSSLTEIIHQQLYYKKIKEGYGKDLNNSDRIKIGYEIRTTDGRVLFAHFKLWMKQSEMIPGLSYGMKGMKIGEERQLYIHPCLAYGVITSLPPCIELIANVTLFDTDETIKSNMPDIKPINMEWVKDPYYQKTIEESLVEKPKYHGSFFRGLIGKIEGEDRDKIIEEFKMKIKLFNMRTSYLF